MASSDRDKYVVGIDPARNQKGTGPITAIVGPGNTLSSVIKKGYRDYDDFLREVGGEHQLGARESMDSDSVWIIDRHTGQEYRLTYTQASAEGITSVPTGHTFTRNSLGQKSAPAPMTTTHIFDEGRVLCGFFKGRLVDWPKGHDQMSLQAYRLQRGGANCFQCTQKAAELEL